MIAFPLTKVVNGNKMFPIIDCGLREATFLIDLERNTDPYKMVGALQSGKILKSMEPIMDIFGELKEMKLSYQSKEGEKYFMRNKTFLNANFL